MKPMPLIEYREYVRGISFLLLQPHHPIPRGLRRLTRVLMRIGVSFEHLNTRLPQTERNIAKALYPLCKIPRMSTLAIGAAINYAVSLMAPGLDYVNIGVWHGFSFLVGNVSNEDKRCVGVDNFSRFGGPEQQFRERFEAMKGPNSQFFAMDYVDFLQNHYQGAMGVYAYDGPHSYEHQLKALELAEPFFAEDCIVIVDDTNWDAPRQATEDFMHWSRNSYEILLDIKTSNRYHPTFWNGIMILQRKG